MPQIDDVDQSSCLHPPISKRADWQPESVLVVQVVNTMDIMVNLRISFRGTDQAVMVRVGLFPNWPTTVTLPLKVMAGDKLFLKRTPGSFKTKVIGANLTIDELQDIGVDCADAARPYVKVTRLEVVAPEDAPQTYTMPTQPQVDALHQWRHKSWPGKAESIEQVRATLQAELAAQEPRPADDRSRYGGWTRQQFESTGFFRTHHDGRRWWLVDPAGHPFWSVGMDSVRLGTPCQYQGIESVFEPPLPSRDAEPELYTVKGREPVFDAIAHNLKRALGEGWREAWHTLTRRRLRRLGFNTLGNFSHIESIRSSGLPYVLPMVGFPVTDHLLFRDFPDVFSEQYTAISQHFAQQLEAVKDDPLLIGYFMTNEPKWAFERSFDLGRQLLRSTQDTATMRAWLQHLQTRYEDIAALNRAWQASFSSFDDLKQAWDPRRVPASQPDTQAFTALAVDRFVRVPAEACKAVDPNHLNLGTRWAYIHSDYQLAGSDVLDAFSINSYRPCPVQSQVEELVEKSGRPLIIGEFHVGCQDRGLPSGGVRNVRTMAESVAAYRYYIEQAASLPGLIGAHYFQWIDQHIMGRSDGENMQIGLNDITYRLYPEWEQMCSEVHAGIYAIANGERPPFDHAPDLITEGTLGW